METTEIILLALNNGISKKSGKPWFKITLKGHDKNGAPIIKDHFVSADAVRPLLEFGAVEDVPVTINCEMDAYLNPSICSIIPLDR